MVLEKAFKENSVLFRCNSHLKDTVTRKDVYVCECFIYVQKSGHEILIKG